MNKIHSTAILLLHWTISWDCKISLSNCTVQNEKSAGSTSVNFFPSAGHITYLRTHVQIGWPTCSNHCNCQQPLAVNGKSSVFKFTPGLQGRVYPPSSSSNVLSCFLILLSSLLGYTFWRVSSGNWPIHPLKAHLPQLNW